MSPTYNQKLEAIETVYTYEEWLKEYNKRKLNQRIKQNTELLYYIKQKLSGLVMTAIGIVMPFLLEGDISASLILVPLGGFLIFTKQKVMIF